jgi:hypothetical protein
MRRTPWLAAALLLAIGCGNENANPTPEPSSNTEPSHESAAGPHIQDETFDLLASPSDHYAVGQAGTFDIRLTPRGQYHVNADPRFPFSIALSGPPAVHFAKSPLGHGDAAEFTEQRARFAVAFTPAAAGSHRVTATVDFAVCTPTTCMPDQRTLAFVLPVQ